MQKNVCLQQDICLYPDKTLQKLKSASRVINARSMSHNTHLRYNFTDKTLKKDTVALSQLHTIRSRSVAISLYQRVRGVYAIMRSLTM